MNRDFDDFQDEYDQIRRDHSDNLDHDQYGEYYDPNSENFYDLDVYSVDYAKSLFHGLGDIARYKGFNRVGEKIPLKNYFDNAGNSIQFPEDDPNGLYHLNNQTILDPSTMPDEPVDPQAFLGRVIKELVANKVHISNNMPDLLVGMCRLFNFSIQPNAELPRTIKNLVFPAQTGVGKSVSVQVYISMLEEHSSVVVVSKVEEAIKYCNYINQLSGDASYARCYYSLTDKNKDDPARVEAYQLRNYRCIVITHNMFRRVNGLDKVDYFREYNEKPRNFIAIDEKLSFYEQFRLNYKEIDRIIDNVESAVEESEKLGGIDTSHEALRALKDFKEFLLFKEDKIVTNDESITVKVDFGQEIKAKLLAIGETITFSALSNHNQSPLKLVGLKNKDAAVKILRSNGIATQARKRNVMGVSSKEVARKWRTIDKNVDSFYCDKFNLTNVNRPASIKASSPVDDKGLLSLFDDDNFDGVLTEEQVKSFQKLEIKRSRQYGLELVSSIIKVILEARVDELLANLEALGANKNPTYRENTLDAISEQLSTLRYFSKNDFLIYKTNYYKALIATENLVNQLGLSVVLDATAQINEYYKLANRFLGHVGFVTAPQIRKYQNLTIYKANGFNQSRSSIYRGKTNDEMQAIAKSYASYALNELDENDRMLIICHKDFVSAIKTHVNDNRVEYTHWGNHVGRNDWSHCNKVMLIGWNYLPPIEHVSSINSSLESVLLTSRHLDDDLIEKFSVSQLADDIIQGVMRSQARVIATDDSDCKPTSFYLFFQDDDRSNAVIDLVESQFPNAKICKWIPNGYSAPKKKSKRDEKDDEVINYLLQKAKDHETYLRKDIQDELKINKSTMGRMIERDYFKDQMAKNGITFTNRDGKSQQFILK